MHLGVQELVVILIIVIVLFGGSRLAGIGKALGTSMREFKEEVNRSESDDEKKDISKDEKSEK
ncbi:MAG: twin-arginine translocase TatA/TatE family subunit [Megasphaera micronuciformis]|jgi:twin arginine-targeting protein translocase, tatA/E family|nr:twin-arginine translocase TatA/TatE family subunit [Megasphaera micronuciformis]